MVSLFLLGLFIYVFNQPHEEFFSVDGVDFKFIVVVKAEPYVCSFYERTDTLNSEKTNGLFFELDKRFHAGNQEFSLFQTAHAAMEPGVSGCKDTISSFQISLHNSDNNQKLDINKQLYFDSELIDLNRYGASGGIFYKIKKRRYLDCRRILSDGSIETHNYQLTKLEDGSMESTHTVHKSEYDFGFIESIYEFTRAFNSNARSTKGMSQKHFFLFKPEVPICDYNGLSMSMEFGNGDFYFVSHPYTPQCD